MHPGLLEALNSQRIAELTRQADRARIRRGLASRRPRAAPIRQRTGWALVGLGLRLAAGAPRG
jgi:hypothetical protein